jgi:hypothetical protein
MDFVAVFVSLSVNRGGYAQPRAKARSLWKHTKPGINLYS